MRTEKILKAGPFTVLYQNGFLRYINYGSTEIVRMIYFALRDENWGTYEAEIENEEVTIQEDSFKITYDCFNRKNETAIVHWKASIIALPTGEIVFEIHGEALMDVKKNRAGFCLLHPIRETIGQPCKIIHADGSISNSMFPEFVASENPFKNIREFHWAIDNNWFEVKFEGDVFETEDQRNWTDASFKTFCTPLDLPFPVALNKGDRIQQKIIFNSSQPVSNIQKQDLTSLVRETKPVTKKIAIGIGASTEAAMLTPRAIALLRDLNLSHYRIEVYPAQADWAIKLSTDYANASTLNLSLEVALHVTESFENEIDAFIVNILQNQVKVKSIILLSENMPVTNQAVINYVHGMKSQLPTVMIGAGTDFNFTELNRNHFRPTNLDFITFSIHPQEHAFDDLSLMETIEAQADVVRSAQNIYKKIYNIFECLEVLITKNYDQIVLSNKDRVNKSIMTSTLSRLTGYQTIKITLKRIVTGYRMLLTLASNTGIE